MNTRRWKPLSDADFRRELEKVVNGDPDADPGVQEFFEHIRVKHGIKVALPHPDGVEVLRRDDGRSR
ncbi:MAG: hypothetical protein ACTH2Q_01545 [Propionibacteriaceae bacterium]